MLEMKLQEVGGSVAPKDAKAQGQP
jgi:hypothetical protein